jgi:hypothetical protein
MLGPDRRAVAAAQPGDEAAEGRAVGSPGRIAFERAAEDLDQLVGRRDDLAGDSVAPLERGSCAVAAQGLSLPANDSCDAGGGLEASSAPTLPAARRQRQSPRAPTRAAS